MRKTGCRDGVDWRGEKGRKLGLIVKSYMGDCLTKMKVENLVCLA